MSEKEKMASVLVNMPESLKNDFKEVLKRNGSSMNAVIRILIAEYVMKMEELEEKEKPKKAVRRKKKSGE